MYFEAGSLVSKPFIILLLVPKFGFKAKYYISKLASTSGMCFPSKVSILDEAKNGSIEKWKIGRGKGFVY